MRLSSAKNEVELPLLDKSSGKLPSLSKENSFYNQDDQQTPKYFTESIFNFAVFRWVDSFLNNKSNEPFQQENHYGLRNEEESDFIAKRFLGEWQKARKERFPLLKTQYRTFKTMIWNSQALAILDTCFAFTAPMLVSRIIRYIQDPESSLEYGIVLILAFIICRVGAILANSQSTQYLTMLQNRILKGSLSLVYHKSLNFPLIKNQDISAGNILNFMTVDVENMSKIFFVFPQLVQLPILLILGFIIIYKSVGMVMIAGGIIMVISSFSISIISKIGFRYQKKIMDAKDVRMKKTNEILSGIKYVKMCGTEAKFLENVDRDRELELSYLKRRNLLEGFRIITFWLSPALVNLTLIGGFMIINGGLDPESIFVIISTLQVIQNPLNSLGTVISDLLQGQISLDRIQKFLFSEDVDLRFVKRRNEKENDTAIKVTNGNFYWMENAGKLEEKESQPQQNAPQKKLILKDFNLEIKKGSFVAILGDVGSGKSSFFNALLGEMSYDDNNPPSIEIDGKIVYMAQKPWIMNATIKQNILFDKEFNAEAYQEAIRTSCLQSDLKMLIKKDETEIGEKGVNLSGGQKARVGLARAIYSNRDIYLMDDPLSAVDAHVAKFILEECLMKKLKDKTRVLVTHKLESLRYVDYIYIFKNGKIVAQGDFEEIKQTSYYQEIEENANKEIQEEEKDIEALERKISSKKNSTHELTISKQKSQRKETSIHEGQDQKEIMDKLMLNEDRQTGAVTFSVWKSYFQYFGSPFFIFCFIGGIFGYLTLKTVSEFWLAHWTTVDMTVSEHGNGYYYGIFTTMTFIWVFLMFLRMGLAVLGGLGVSKRLHIDMFTRVIRAPLNLFFDRIPLGRLINRFANDLNTVDAAMPFALSRVAFAPVELSIKIIACGIAGTLWVFPLAGVFVTMCLRIQKKYFKVYREVFRLSRITSSPVISLIAESLDGLTQIRSLDCQKKFLKELSEKQNENMKNLILISGLTGWFSLWINISSLLVTAPTIAAAVLLSREMGSNAGLMGLMVTYLMDISGLMTFVLTIYSTFESNLISFERCRAFTKVDVEHDPQTHLPVENYSHKWPEHGEIEFRNYYAKYRPNLPYVLKDVSFKINGGEKIGVVGRTGSGKSTTLLSLLRIIEPQGGQIFIDGVDTSHLGLDDLRKKITIIPQDPLLYKGSLKVNLDLHGQFGEREIWNALEKVCMKDKFKQEGLDFEVKEGGENLSAGEKQLLCIARAILNKNKIILVDEATSSIDNVTEDIILESIRENFKDCTMITIAHRLKTVIESDRILFMGDGKVLEFDTPKNLLNNKNGHFYALWKEYEAAKA